MDGQRLEPNITRGSAREINEGQFWRVVWNGAWSWKLSIKIAKYRINYKKIWTSEWRAGTWNHADHRPPRTGAWSRVMAGEKNLLKNAKKSIFAVFKKIFHPGARTIPLTSTWWHVKSKFWPVVRDSRWSWNFTCAHLWECTKAPPGTCIQSPLARVM